MHDHILFYLNGKKQKVAFEKANTMLSDYLRYELCLTGTKVVCAEGDCGACTVLRYFPTSSDPDYFLPINSCILPLVKLHGSHILTVESLAKDETLHPAQKAIVDHHGSQCGFCTPGFVMSLTGLCESKLAGGEKTIGPKEAKNSMTGNLCRCTGYQSLINSATEIDLNNLASLQSRYHTPAVEAELKKIVSQEVMLENEDFHFYAPTTWQKAVAFYAQNDDIRLIAKGTDLGVVSNKRKIRLNRLLSLHLIDEAHEIKEDKGIISVGANVSLSSFRRFLEKRIPEYASYLDLFASPQIKNIATLVGNIANASPIGDNAPALLALDAKLILISCKGERSLPLSEFFLNYRETALQKNELIKKIEFKIPASTQKIKMLKNSVRKDLDISTMNLAMSLEGENAKITNLRLAAGGIAAIPLRLKKTEAYLKNKQLDSQVIEEALKLVQSEFTPLSDLRSSATYRRVVLANFLKRALSEFAGVGP